MKLVATPGDIDTDAGARAERLLNKTVKWTEEMYDWDEETIYNYLHQKDKMPVVYIEYSYRQIGLTDSWFKEISKKIGNNITVRREILLQRLRGSSESPYDRDDIDRLIELTQRPIESVMLNTYYRLDIYERLNRSIPYLVGIDCATGNDGDNNAITVVNPYTLKVCAEFECSYVGEPDFIEVIKELVKKYIPRAILCIERNSVGDAIIKFLMKSEIAGRVYFDKFKEISEKNMEEMSTIESILKKKARQSTFYGVYTSPKSREVMFSILANWIKNKKENFVGQNVTRDITKLVSKGGKVQAAAGFHDDSVMSLLVALYVYYHGNNLEIFGFSHGDEFFMEEKNQGLDRPEDIDTSDMSEEVKGFVEKMKKDAERVSYDDMLYNAIIKEQEQRALLAKKGLVDDPTYKDIGTSSNEYEDNVDLDFFDDLNGF